MDFRRWCALSSSATIRRVEFCPEVSAGTDMLSILEPHWPHTVQQASLLSQPRMNAGSTRVALAIESDWRCECQDCRGSYSGAGCNSLRGRNYEITRNTTRYSSCDFVSLV